jgi:uncharacterized protein (TIGR02452 family)
MMHLHLLVFLTPTTSKISKTRMMNTPKAESRSLMSSPHNSKDKFTSPEDDALPRHDDGSPSSTSTLTAAKQKMASVDLPYALDPVGGGVDRKTCSKMTFSRTWLVHLANDTAQIGQQGYYTNAQGETVNIADALSYARRNSVHYHCSHVFDTEALLSSSSSKTTTTTPQPQLFDTHYKICYGSSLNVATALYQAHPKREFLIGILNSASSKTPGGKFFRGTIAQEDCICRASLLYHCLFQYIHREHHFYLINNKPKYQSSSSSCAIFSPRVPVIRHDTLRGEILDEYYQFSFVSIPAPNAFVLGREEEECEGEGGGVGHQPKKSVPQAQTPGAMERGEAYEHMTLTAALRDRCLRALCIFAQQNMTELVLCAFGCGVHGNRPKDVAACFRDILNTELKGRFRTVAFAILPSRPMNYEAFCDAFPEAVRS